MEPKTNDIKILNGKSNPNILLIAPHGYPDDDENTGHLARLINDTLDCPTIINEVYRKPAMIGEDPELWEVPNINEKILDLNRKPQAERHKKYIRKIKESIKEPQLTTVFWIHGISDENIQAEIKEMGASKDLKCLIGYGQPKTHSMNKKTVNKFINALKANGIIAASTRNEADNYRAANPLNMNQWFKQSGNGFEKVQSVQLEFGYKGIRDPENLDKIAKAISNAILQMTGTLNVYPVEKVADGDLVNQAFNFLKGVFVKHFQNAMLDAGEYIIKEFFEGDYERAKNPRNAVKIRSFGELTDRLKENSGHAPSKTWVYDAVKLAIDEHHFKSFSVYGNLGHSHKVLLLRAPKDEIKKQLAEETVKQNYTAAELRERINDVKNGNKLRVDHVLTFEELTPLEMKELERLEKQASDGVARSQEQLKLNKESLKQIKQVIAEKAKDNGSESKKSGFRDWTEPANNVNICTGCENDCIYCYAHSMARRFHRLNGNPWHDMKIRQHDVDKKRKLHDGLVGFPSSHDITPSNIDAFLTVLGNLLRAGNEVLIVSKPRIDCIKQICDACYFFKNKILFRFTIGAMDDTILSYWEPNAPKYKERKKCLKYALKNGFRTSVSMEPMLDTPNIETLIKDFEPLSLRM